MKHIQTVTIGDRHTAATYRLEGAPSARAASRSVATGDRRVVDFANTLLMDVSDKGGQLPAGMHFPIGEERHKVKGGPAPKPGTPAEGSFTLLLQYDIEQIVLQPDDGVCLGGLQVLCKKAGILIAGGELEAGSLSDL